MEDQDWALPGPLRLPGAVSLGMAGRARARRKQLRMSQRALAQRSGVSFGSIQRFEQSGLVSLESLLKIAFALDCLEGFDLLFPPDNRPRTLEEVLGQ